MGHHLFVLCVVQSDAARRRVATAGDAAAVALLVISLAVGPALV